MYAMHKSSKDLYPDNIKGPTNTREKAGRAIKNV